MIVKVLLRQEVREDTQDSDKVEFRNAAALYPHYSSARGERY